MEIAHLHISGHAVPVDLRVLAVAVGAKAVMPLHGENLFILCGVWFAFSRVRRGGKIVDEDLNTLLAGRGLLARLFRRIFD